MTQLQEDKGGKAVLLHELESSQGLYLKEISSLGNEHKHKIHKKLSYLTKSLQRLMRLKAGSNNSAKLIPDLARMLFNAKVEPKRLNLPPYSFQAEKKIIDYCVKNYLESKRASNYDRKCASYGETLLSCYLDAFINLSVSKTSKKIGDKPSFLVYPNTGAHLEIDVLIEKFRLAFEFQGEHHYQKPKVQAEDSFKVSACASHNILLIPVNISQLRSLTLQNLVSNCLKDHLGVHNVLVRSRPVYFRRVLSKIGSRTNLKRFYSIMNRFHLASALYTDTLSWLDKVSEDYINNMKHGNPTSTSTPAPRPTSTSPDVDFELIHKRIHKRNIHRKLSRYKQRTKP